MSLRTTIAICFNKIEKFFNLPSTHITDISKDVDDKDILSWSLAVLRLTSIVALLSFIAVVISTVFIIMEFNKSRKVAEMTNVILNAPKISFPPNGASVRSTGIVEGYSPYAGKNVYVLITAIDNNEYLQDKATVGMNGVWRTSVFYGTEETPLGATFYIRSIITSKTIETIRNPPIPDDAIVTNSIMVTLTK